MHNIYVAIDDMLVPEDIAPLLLSEKPVWTEGPVLTGTVQYSAACQWEIPELLKDAEYQQPPLKEVVCKLRPIGAYGAAKATKKRNIPKAEPYSITANRGGGFSSSKSGTTWENSTRSMIEKLAAVNEWENAVLLIKIYPGNPPVRVIEKSKS